MKTIIALEKVSDHFRIQQYASINLSNTTKRAHVNFVFTIDRRKKEHVLLVPSKVHQYEYTLSEVCTDTDQWIAHGKPGGLEGLATDYKLPAEIVIDHVGYQLT